MRIAFDTDTCGRCGGTGQMPFAAYGGVCFGCNGKGERMTRQGAKAYRWFEAWADKHLTVAASQLQPGDRIRGFTKRSQTFTVTAVTVTLGKGNGTSRVGDAVYDAYGNTTIEYGHQNTASGPAHRAIRLPWTHDAIRAAVSECRMRTGFTVEEN